jgi:hypothetical protein
MVRELLAMTEAAVQPEHMVSLSDPTAGSRDTGLSDTRTLLQQW